MATPKLRFKEFGGCWENTSFQSLFTFKNGINASKEQYGSGTKFINVLDIINNPNGITYDSIIGSVQVFQKDIDKNLVNYGDVVFQRSSETREEVGQSNVYLSKEPVVFGGFVIRGSARVPYDPLFMNGLLKTDKVRDQITQLSGGSTRFNIGQDSLNKVSVFLPSKEEQTKIASFLSAVDEKISQLSQKHQLLSQYKQGMMQKLFSQQIRFKADDGSEFGEWEETTLGKVVNFQNGKRVPLSESDRQKRQGKYRYYGASGVIDHIDDYIFDGQYILIGEDGANIITRSSPLAFIVEGQFWVNNHAHIFQSKNGSNVFLAAYLESLNYEKFNSGTAQPKLNLDNLKKVPVINPCLDEQTKIANFLSAIDQKIEVVAQQIEQAKTWKKGLLQQMFV